jgi:hypothetical protein
MSRVERRFRGGTGNEGDRTNIAGKKNNQNGPNKWTNIGVKRKLKLKEELETKVIGRT